MQHADRYLADMQLLALFNLDNHQEGIKLHHDAEPAKLEAAERLYRKGLLSQPDGGYLTSLGRDAAEHLQALLTILASDPQS